MAEDIGKLLLRLNLGGLLLCRGAYFLFNGLDAIKAFLVANGLPEVLAYGIYVGELVAPLLILLGLFTRIGGFLVVVNMLAAVLLARIAEVMLLHPRDSGFVLELEAFYLVGGLCVILFGPGRFAIERLWQDEPAESE